MVRKILALCCQEVDSDREISSFENSDIFVLVSIPDNSELRVLTAPASSRRPVGRAEVLRTERPDVVITSAIDPYSLVALSAKGIEVRLVSEGTPVSAAIDAYVKNRARLACKPLRD